jgi:flavin reductase (DIM6/NTAB) family NADH-FMN oxidoreductase RutF
MPIDPIEFRETLGRWCSGVTVVTMRDRETVHGITVSAFGSLSLDPPLIGIAIARRARAHGYLERVQRFAVSILSEDQRQLSEHFAGRPIEVPDGLFEDFAELPFIRGALAYLDCSVVQRVAVGDHTLYVGQIERTNLTDRAPLAYYRGQYRRLG